MVQADKIDNAGSIALVWFRRDLRLTDHEALHSAVQAKHDRLLPVYCIDPRELRPRQQDEPHGMADVPRLGPHRLNFLLEAAAALQRDLRELSSDLLFTIAQPEALLPALVHQLRGQCSHMALYHQQEPLQESADCEDEVQRRLRAAAAECGISADVSSYWGLTLYHPDDLPYADLACGSRRGASVAPAGGRPNSDAGRYRCLPAVMTDFRKTTLAAVKARKCLPRPGSLPALPAIESQQLARAGGAIHYASTCIPTDVQQVYGVAGAAQHLHRLEALTGCSYGGTPGVADPRSAFPFKGGEAAGMARLRSYTWGSPQGAGAGPSRQQAPALSYFSDTRAQAVGVDNSTKLSPYLAAGCLSPRMVLQELQLLQAAAPPEGQLEWLHMHLCIRDFFIFTALKEGPAMMSPAGIKGVPLQWANDVGSFTRWAQGRTGLPFVDACMRELAGSGYMSNRGRQNVASLLAKELRQEWRAGAALFESLLLDHDVAVNYCNWNYFAGIGNDPRNRHFKTVTQGEQYDAAALLAQAWLPELAQLPPGLRHRPWEMTEEQAAGYGYVPGVTYPQPMVDPAGQVGLGPKNAKKGSKRRQQRAASSEGVAVGAGSSI